MNQSDRDHINRCKKLIQEKFRFEKENGNLRQRDLEYLAEMIEDQSGIKLSLSTLKRFWKDDYEMTPHLSTLQGLVSVLGYKEWYEFKLQEKADGFSKVETKTDRTGRRFNPWMILPALVLLALLTWLIAFRSRSNNKGQPIINGPIIFNGNKTVAGGVPNTIIFNYDVSQVIADSFFFQQAWNEQEKIKIDPKGHYYSNIYYYPGYHKAKLIANDSILKRFPVHITTGGWLPLVRYSFADNIPIYIRKENLVTNGALHVTRKDLLS